MGKESSKITVPVPDNRLFTSAKYETRYKWLYYSAANFGYKCKYCEFAFENKSSIFGGEEVPYVTVGLQLGSHPGRKLEKHDKASRHQNAYELYQGIKFPKSSQSVLLTMFQKAKTDSDAKRVEELRQNYDYMEALFKSANFMIRKRWAVSDNLQDLITNLLGNDLEYTVVSDHIKLQQNLTYTSPSSVSDIIESLAFAFEDEVLQSLRKATYFTLLADESSDDAHRAQFAIITRFWRDGSIQDCFLGIVRLARTDAESLMTAIETFLVAKGIDIKKAAFVGFDGCNTMSGVNKGVQRRFRHVVPHQIYINCRNHKLALCVKHLIKDFPILQDLDNLLIDIWKLFENSPQIFSVFEEVQQVYNMTKLTFIRAATTHWLSHGKACDRLLKRYVQVLDSLDSIYEKKREPEILGLRDMLTNKSTAASVTVLNDILRPLVLFSDYLQGDVNFSRVNSKLKELLDMLHHLVVRFRSVAQGHHDLDLSFSKLPTLWEETDDRTDIARRLRNRGVYNINQIVEELAVPMVYGLINELEDGFHCSPILSAFSVFYLKTCPVDAADLPEYGRTQIRYLAEHYGQTIEDVIQGNRVRENPVFPEDAIKPQFEAFKHQMFMVKQRASEDEIGNPQFLLSKIRQDDVLQQVFPAMTYLLLLSCLIPVSTACVERVFSLMNSLCTPLRVSMKQNTLDSLMKINFEGLQSLSPEQLKGAIDHFKTRKNRILQF